MKGVVEATSGTLRLSLLRYMNGLSDYLPVLEAQQSFFTSRRDLINARRQLISDRIQLIRALGGEWGEEMVDKRLVKKR